MNRYFPVFLLPCIFLLAGCSENRQSEAEAIPVTVYVVEPSVITETVNIPCRLESAMEAVISVSVPGVVEEVLVSPGDTVQFGERLLVLNCSFSPKSS